MAISSWLGESTINAYAEEVEMAGRCAKKGGAFVYASAFSCVNRPWEGDQRGSEEEME